MITLTATTDKIQAVLAGAITTNQLQCATSWTDATTTDTTGGRTLTNTNNTTDVDLVGAPAASTTRLVDYISIYNNDTVSATVTVKFDANGTEYILFKGTIGSGERLEYTKVNGFQVFTSNGSVKNETLQGAIISTPWTEVVLAADDTNSNATANTLEDLNGLVFALTAGNTYAFELFGAYTAAATTTGCRFTVNGPAATWLSYNSRYTLTATTETVNYATAYQIPAASNASSLTTGNTVFLQGIVKPSANGNLQAQFASEVLSSAIVAKAGMVFRIRQVL